MKTVDVTYLGDSVYANFDGYQIELFTFNGLGVTNQIYLDPETLKSFLSYVKEVRNEK